MEVTKIFNRLQKTEHTPEYYFVLQIGPDIVKSAVWTIDQSKVKILSLGETLDWETEDRLLSAVDATLSSASERVTAPSFSEPNKVIFGLPKDWVDADKIITTKVNLLKDLSQKLDLKPVGFVVTPEAITFHLKNLEGVPPTVILAGLGKQNLTVSLVNLGKLEGSHLVVRSDNLGADLAEGLSHFAAVSYFPSRILLYNGNHNLEELGQQLINFSWNSAGINFLHLPKVEILPPDFDLKATALAGGQELGQVQGLEETPPAPQPVPPLVSPSPLEPEIPDEVPPLSPPAKNSLGFVYNQDITQITPEALPSLPPDEPQLEPEVIQSDFEPAFVVPKQPVKIKLKLPQFHFHLPHPTFINRRIWLILGVALICLFALGGGLLYAYWNYPTASVTLYTQPKFLEKDFDVKLDPNLDAPDTSKFILPAPTAKIAQEGEKTLTTTGTKTIGDPAKGEVKIYNATSSPKTFAAKTVITSTSGIKFLLDSDVQIASQSGTAADLTPGVATVSITAQKVGAEGNLAAGSEFSLSNYAKADFVAKNDNALTGGSSKDVQVVAQADVDKLLKSLTDDLQNQAKSQLTSQITSGSHLIENTLTTKVLDKNYNSNVGDVSDEVKLKLKLEITTLSYKENDLLALLTDGIKAAIPSDYEYKPEDTEFHFTVNKVNPDTTVSLTVHLKANLLPIFNLDTIKNNLAGKSPQIGKNYLNDLPNVKGLEFKITPSLPQKIMSFPHQSKNITLEIKRGN